MNLSLWHLFALTTYVGIAAAFLSVELTEYTLIASSVLSLVYATIAIGLAIYGDNGTRAFAVGAAVPLIFLCAALSLLCGIAMLDEPFVVSGEECLYTWLVGAHWLMAAACGFIVATIRACCHHGGRNFDAL